MNVDAKAIDFTQVDSAPELPAAAESCTIPSQFGAEWARQVVASIWIATALADSISPDPPVDDDGQPPLPLAEIEKYRKRHDPDKDSSVYFMADEKSRIKIGYSKDPERRRKEIEGNPDLQCEFVAGPISLLGVIPGGRITEQMLHRTFRRHRIAGEWFCPSLAIKALIAEVSGGAA